MATYNAKQIKIGSDTINLVSKPTVNEADLSYDSNDVLSLANRSSDNGLGYVILRQGESFQSQVNSENTIYEIRYNFNVGGTSAQPIEIPNNSTLLFKGGSLDNGYIKGNNTKIDAVKGNVIFKDTYVSGTWDVDTAWSSWFNCYKDGYKVTDLWMGTEQETALTLIKGGACRKSDGTTIFTGDSRTQVYKADVTGMEYIHIHSNSVNRTIGVSFFKSDTVFDNTTCLSGGISANGKFDSKIRVPAGAKTVCIPVSDNYTGAFVKQIEYIDVNQSNAWYSIEKSDGTTETLAYATEPTVTTHDDTLKLQSLIDLNARHTIIEDGVYMINAHRVSQNGKYYGLTFINKFDQILEINGTLKHYQTHNNNARFMLAVQSTKNCTISGSGEIQGDMLEDPNKRVNGDGPGTGMIVASSVDLNIKGLTFRYHSCDGVIVRYAYSFLSSDTVNDQYRHRLENVTFAYNHRTGLVYENGDNVIVENCCFEGNGYINGTNDKAAVDVEPFNYNIGEGVFKRYCNDFTFRNNKFYRTWVGLKLERCLNTQIYNNDFNNGIEHNHPYFHTLMYPEQTGYTQAIQLIASGRASWDKDDETAGDSKYIRSKVRIYNNKVENFDIFINAIQGNGHINSFEAYDNIIVNSGLAFYGGQFVFRLVDCVDSRIHHNELIGCNSIIYPGHGSYVFDVSNVEFDHNRVVLGYHRKADLANSGTFHCPIRFDTPAEKMKVSIHDNIFETPNITDIEKLRGSGRYGQGYVRFMQYYSAGNFNDWYNTSHMWYSYKDGIYNNVFKGPNLFRGNCPGFSPNDLVTEECYSGKRGAKYYSDTYKQEGIVEQDFKIKYFDRTWDGTSDLDVTAGEWINCSKAPLNGSSFLVTNTGTLKASEYPTSYPGSQEFICGDVFMTSGTSSYKSLIVKWISVGRCKEGERPTTLNHVGRKLLEEYTINAQQIGHRIIVCTKVNADGSGEWEDESTSLGSCIHVGPDEPSKSEVLWIDTTDYSVPE